MTYRGKHFHRMFELRIATSSPNQFLNPKIVLVHVYEQRSYTKWASAWEPSLELLMIFPFYTSWSRNFVNIPFPALNVDFLFWNISKFISRLKHLHFELMIIYHNQFMDWTTAFGLILTRAHSCLQVPVQWSGWCTLLRLWNCMKA